MSSLWPGGCLARSCWCCSVAQLCPTLCDPMDCSPPSSPVHGIFQARILEWVAISFSRESSQPRDGTSISHTDRQILYHWVNREAPARGYWRSLHPTPQPHYPKVGHALVSSLPKFPGRKKRRCDTVIPEGGINMMRSHRSREFLDWQLTTFICKPDWGIHSLQVYFPDGSQSQSQGCTKSDGTFCSICCLSRLIFHSIGKKWYLRKGVKELYPGPTKPVQGLRLYFLF